MRKTELHQGLVLGLSTAIALTVIIVTFHATKGIIKETQQRELEATLTQLLQPNSYDNQPATDAIQLTHDALGSDEPKAIYRASLNDQDTGAVVSAVAPDGYNGDINLLIGFTFSGEIVAVRVTSHSETPGLGDDIEATRSDWIYAFNDLSPTYMESSAWQIKKDGGQFDQFTGASITPRAVVHSVRRVASWFLTERDAIFNQ